MYTDPVSIVECRHTFCKNCYTTLVRISKKPNFIDCPLCKKPVSRREFEEDEQLPEIVKLVQNYKNILSKQSVEIGKKNTDFLINITCILSNFSKEQST